MPELPNNSHSEDKPVTPSSILQIKEMDKMRPSMKPHLIPTPSGPVWNEEHIKAARSINNDIDRRQARMQARLEKRRNQARDDFNRHHDRGMGR